MKHILFQEAEQYPICLLIKETSLDKQAIINNYILPLEAAGIGREKVIAFDLPYDGKKVSAKLQKEYLADLLPALKQLGVKFLYCCDSNYFKTLIKSTKTDVHLGYTLPCAIPGFETMQVILGINHHAALYSPNAEQRMALGNKTLIDVMNQSYKPLGDNIIHLARYPKLIHEIQQELQDLHQYPVLSADIEAFSLKFRDAGIATIGFAWSKHEGIAFPVDYTEYLFEGAAPDGTHGFISLNRMVRTYLREFFETYQGTLRWHGSTYDLRVLIYQLWMKHPLDREGLLKGLEIMTARMDDTRIIAYLSTNSCAGNELGLKELAHEFAGNWAKGDIKNVRLIPLDELLQYNLVDVLSTNYVYEKHYPKMVEDQQEHLYRTLMLPSLKVITLTELIGMPMEPTQIVKVKAELQTIIDKYMDIISACPHIHDVTRHLQYEAMVAANKKLKTKQHPIEKFADIKFNPGSGQQLQVLLYDFLGLPVIDLTDKKQPATGADTLKKLVNHTQDEDVKTLLKALVSYSQAKKIMSTFIPAFEDGMLKADGYMYLHGCFNLGGTVSGRLSSSDPNLQNTPANSAYGKLIKSIFQAPPGWLMVGADFNALEDRINTLLTKDPNKLKVFVEGYDGHCLRAYAYFKDQMDDIVENAMSVNSIAKKYPHLRQDSKSPSFAMQYAGTWRTLVNNLGWSEDKAKTVEERYKELYSHSIKWVEQRIEEASKKGYAEAAFGLRIRTPLLKQTLLSASGALREAQAEARTLGNAISGQSYGLLNNRALNAFMEEVWASEHRLSIFPIAMIHDAIYLLIKNDPDVVEWVNKRLVKAMEWQELPEIMHDQVKLGAELDIFFPSWADKVTIPNDASQDLIIEMATEHAKKVLSK